MKKNVLFSALALFALWAGWLVAYAVVGNDYILPSFWDTVEEGFALLGQSSFWIAFSNTFFRTVYAFLISLFLGVTLAIFSCLRGEACSFLSPVISLLRSVPTMAIILALLLWTSPKTAPVIVAILVLFPAIYVAALTSFEEVTHTYGKLTDAYQVPLTKRIFRMILPLGAPTIAKQLGAMLSMGLKITISAEVLSNTFQSMGGMMQEAKMFVDMPTLLALTVLAILLGFLLEGGCFALVKGVERGRK